MTFHRGMAGLLLLAAAPAGCKTASDLAPASGPPGDFAYAYASPDCAPWDGRAVSIVRQNGLASTRCTGICRRRICSPTARASARRSLSRRLERDSCSTRLR